MKRQAMTLRKQIMLFYVFGCALPLIVILVMISFNSLNATTSVIERGILNSAEIYSKNLETDMNAILDFMELIRDDTYTKEVLTRAMSEDRALTWKERSDLSNRLYGINLCRYVSGVDRLVITDELGNAYHFFDQRNAYSILKESLPVDELTLQMDERPMSIYYGESFEVENTLRENVRFFSLSCRMRNQSTDYSNGLKLTEPYGLLMIFLNRDFFLLPEYLQDMGVMILDSDGGVLLHFDCEDGQQPEMWQLADASGLQEHEVLIDRGFAFTAQKMSGFEYTIVYYMPITAFTANGRGTGWAVIVLVAMSATFALFGMYYLLKQTLARPLMRLSEGMREVEKGNLLIRLDDAGSGEMRELIGRFNHMMEELAQSIEQRREAESRLIREEIRNIQMRLNPHFLYNTLGTIRVFAIENGQKQIEMIVTKLTRLLREMIRNLEEETPLKNELATMEDYVGIQAIRYPGRFRYVCQVQPEAESIMVPSMLLQPLVENALMHGILPLHREGQISVRARIEDAWLVIEIEDDGNGFSEEALEHISEEQQAAHLGFMSVNRMLRLRYGEEYGLKAENTRNGARVTAVLPVDRKH